ncbi:FAD-binding and (Fe-S)-binding domain-containing protein [Thalassospira sp. MCCC 1A03138]|uniref:FAD-binding and (Fe-S)-binding domain-containing protein n=1 Tax=Thalassospira sp. MCCC 1A03138 TaxID=1470576 RepID=UPI000A1FF351|nr:FAD-binding and (Fe-S)-binding domain-containing protein [Thalassospira sp. MCCC 1A03138]
MTAPAPTASPMTRSTAGSPPARRSFSRFNRLPVLTPDRSLDSLTLGFLKALEKEGKFAGEIHADFPSRLINATDNSVYQVMPTAVLQPKNCNDINVVMELAGREEFSEVKITPRGGGTGTNGQSLNNTITLDTSKHLNNILGFDAEKGQVHVEPGVVLDQLNAWLKPHGFFFPPAVSTASRATIGGMIGSDSSGKGSRIYGKTSHYINDMTTVLIDGTDFRTHAMSAVEAREIMARDDRTGRLYRKIHDEIMPRRDQINAIFPEMNRGLTGYNLKEAVSDQGDMNLSFLIAGAEGSLGMVKEITLRVIPLPKHKAVTVVRYDSFDSALRHVGTLVQFDPVAIESIDDKVMELAKQDESWHLLGKLLGTEDSSVPTRGFNVVEFVGETPEDVAAKQAELRTHLDVNPDADYAPIGFVQATDPTQIAAIWSIRAKSVGLLGNLEGKRRATPFVEDTAVPPENLADFIAEFRALLDAEGLDYGMFGHVDVGCLHVRPLLDMCDEQDEARLRRVSDRVVDLTKKYNGLIWGEHGKGFRGEYSPTYFGPELYDVLKRIKEAFDPEGQLNPGKIASPYSKNTPITAIDAAPMRGQLDRQIEDRLRDEYLNATRCNGNGACFNWDLMDAMCPSYKVTRDRVHSPKGRAGLVREWIRQLSVGTDPRNQDLAVINARDFSHDVYDAMAGCLSCKACAGQCPVKVDIPEMKSRFLEAYHTRYKRPVKDYVIAQLESIAPLMAKAPLLFNALQSIPPMPWIFKSLIGLTDLPKLSRQSVGKALRKRGIGKFKLADLEALSDADRAKSVVLLQDCFTSHYDIDVFTAHIDLLQKLGYRVFVPPYRPNGKTLHVKGFLKRFDYQAKQNDIVYGRLAKTGVPLIGIEASVTLTYRQEYAQRLGSDRPDYRVHLFHEWLSAEITENRLTLPASSGNAGGTAPATLFPHCTEKTSIPDVGVKWQKIFEAFGIKLATEKTGCCGMAGVYGHETRHQETSRALYDQSWKKKVDQTGLDNMLVTGYSCRCQVARFEGTKPKHPVEYLTELV